MSGKRNSFVCAEVLAASSNTAKMAAGIRRAKIFFLNKGIPPLVGQSRNLTLKARLTQRRRKNVVDNTPHHRAGFQKVAMESDGNRDRDMRGANQRTSLSVR